MRLAAIFPWIGAVLLGALAPALIVAALLDFSVFQLAFIITLGHAVILGLPVALLYRAKRWTRLSAAIVGSFLIGAIPGGLLSWPVDFSLRSTSSFNSVPLIVEGIPTWDGWIQYFELLGTLGGLGAVGGLAFWLTLRWSGTLKLTDPV